MKKTNVTLMTLNDLLFLSEFTYFASNSLEYVAAL
ncbi:MAG: hypothetical protein H6Q13_749 [Bacteroidetes bacterium]|nr:hypothetical protein [Bacteroidota bacterium]